MEGTEYVVWFTIGAYWCDFFIRQWREWNGK